MKPLTKFSAYTYLVTVSYIIILILNFIISIFTTNYMMNSIVLLLNVVASLILVIINLALCIIKDRTIVDILTKLSLSYLERNRLTKLLKVNNINIKEETNNGK